MIPIPRRERSPGCRRDRPKALHSDNREPPASDQAMRPGRAESRCAFMAAFSGGAKRQSPGTPLAVVLASWFGAKTPAATSTAIIGPARVADLNWLNIDGGSAVYWTLVRIAMMRDQVSASDISELLRSIGDYFDRLSSSFLMRDSNVVGLMLRISAAPPTPRMRHAV